MPTIRLSKPLAKKVRAMQPMVEEVTEQKLDFNRLVELILQHGMETMLASIMRSMDAETFLKSFQQLGDREPSVVYGYVTEMLRSGTGI
jgi:chromatin segregation and condensation protein Rec8/ScpA/Scc1 (kleisin family)